MQDWNLRHKRAKNAGLENATLKNGAQEMQGWKMRDWKMKHKKIQGWKMRDKQIICVVNVHCVSMKNGSQNK